MKLKKVCSAFPLPKLALRYEQQTDQIIVTPPPGHTVTLHSTDCPQVVKPNLQVHQPLSDKEVRLSFSLTDSNGVTTVTGDYTLRLPGKYSKKSATPKPAVIPELAEWYGTAGRLSLPAAAQLSIDAKDAEALDFAAAEFCRDYTDVTGYTLQTTTTEKSAFTFSLSGADPLLGEEGYTITIQEAITVSACTPKGIYWATRTLLQMLKHSNDRHTLPCGSIRDYPRYPVRGFLLDAGRRPISLSMLKEITRNMAWYKMNDLQIHLNDNYIWLEDYNTRGEELDTFEAYEAFRLESSLTNEKGETPTAKDYAYSKAEFRDFIQWAAQYGVCIVPEIDVPAHALSFTKVFPEHMVKGQVSPLMKKRPLTDHLDISKQETMDFVKRIFDDYTSGENPVFAKNSVIHIGADEFLSDYGAYRRFFNQLVPYLKNTNTVRVWGGLSWIKDTPETPIVPEAIEGVQMDLWAKNWADGLEMYQMGFHLVNIIDQYTYMVPNGKGTRGAYCDYLNQKRLYRHFAPYQVGMKNNKYTALPAGDPHVLGAAYALWNDNIDKRASGLTEQDLFERFFEPLPLMAEKTWATGDEKGSLKAIQQAAKQTAFAPGSNPCLARPACDGLYASYSLEGPDGGKDQSGCQRDLSISQPAALTEKGLSLSGGNSHADLPLGTLGFGSCIQCDVTFYECAPGQVLFEADAPYGAHDIRITAEGKLGFTRENYEYAFPYTPVTGMPVHLEIQNDRLSTTLRVNNGETLHATGNFLHNGTVRKQGIPNASLALPLCRIGSKQGNAAKALISRLKVGKMTKPLRQIARDETRGLCLFKK